jgi:predicted RNA-binding Zn-ribbon protein involved in translation (DUF1610 family)
MTTNMKFEVLCSKCGYTGTLGIEENKLPRSITVEGRFVFTGAKCPDCGEESLSAPGGRYERNQEGVFERSSEIAEK